jgi:hypothetical protein
MITSQVVLINPEGLILGVSRKQNHFDFGLVGGKMDPEDNNDPMLTAIRECKEETGLDIFNLKLVFAIHKNGNMGYTYLADYSGEISHNEPHIVKWLPMEVLINGSFGKYNKMVSESLDDMGIDYVYDISIQDLSKDVDDYLNNNTILGMNFKLDRVLKEKDFLGNSQYVVFFDINDDEFLWGFDQPFLNALKTIGEKYDVKVAIPYYYYSK